MPFVPPNDRIRERILSIGGAGMGKSHDFYSIAAKYVATKTTGRFFVIDTDVSVDRHLTTDFVKVDEAGVVVNFDVWNWDTLMTAMDTIMGHDGSNGRPSQNALMGRDDWLMIDLTSPTWDWVQAWFTDQVFNKSRTEYMMEMRKTMRSDDKNAKVFDGWKDWPFITGVYKDEFQNRILRCMGHVYCTSEVKKLDTSTAENDTKVMVGAYGVMPVGQKRTAHIYRTVVLKQTYVQGEWTATTIKDAGRPYMQGKMIKNFAADYLVEQAGWKFEMPASIATLS